MKSDRDKAPDDSLTEPMKARIVPEEGHEET